MPCWRWQHQLIFDRWGLIFRWWDCRFECSCGVTFMRLLWWRDEVFSCSWEWWTFFFWRSWRGIWCRLSGWFFRGCGWCLVFWRNGGRLFKLMNLFMVRVKLNCWWWWPFWRVIGIIWFRSNLVNWVMRNVSWFNIFFYSRIMWIPFCSLWEYLFYLNKCCLLLPLFSRLTYDGPGFGHPTSFALKERETWLLIEEVLKEWPPRLLWFPEWRSLGCLRCRDLCPICLLVLRQYLWRWRT